LNRNIEERVEQLKVFFKPRSIAVIGASSKPMKIGNVIVKQLKKRYSGKLYPVNPRHEEIEGLKCYPTILDVPGDVDLAVISLRADLVPGVVKQSIEKGVKGIIIVSGGFSEIGPEGARLEMQIRDMISRSEVRVIGPNGLGVLDLYTGVDTFFLPEERMKRPPKGRIALISQSGALSAAITDWAAAEGIGISRAVSYGNKIDVDDVDLLYYFAEDEETRVIAMYVEGLKPGRGKEFIEAARYVAGKKPIVLLKGGKTARGAVAAASHTAALAGSYEVFRSALRQAGIIEADSIEDLFDLARALSMQPPAKGRRAAVITNAGGPAVMATDALERHGLEIPILSDETQRKLREKFPPYYVTKNPVDLTGDGSSEDYRHALETVLTSGEIDVLLVIALVQTPKLNVDVADLIVEKAGRHGIPTVAMSFGGELTRKLEARLEENGIPVYETSERAVRALWSLVEYGEIKRRLGGG